MVDIFTVSAEITAVMVIFLPLLVMMVYTMASSLRDCERERERLLHELNDLEKRLRRLEAAFSRMRDTLDQLSITIDSLKHDIMSRLDEIEKEKCRILEVETND